ncbi:polysaccharide biosynthesis/export family protein [Methylorubrum extorquens]|uniref:polysaccharide biosynthesis/export family protein n=1 Tax=Methylorubrum extorquens TaxID=408 RepID=UPI00223723A4|nr:polysaccharide biosynthesis/export family protein [Methylorubrum extorquens]UYW26636.1 polysaccharide biosynthesis/export family protein [Methylorubrum extorquens]
MRPFARIAVSLSAAALLCASAGPGWAAYTISPGDVIEIEVVSIPELKARSVVGGDGEVTVPLVGQVQIGGLALGAARARIQQALPGKEFRRRTIDGREYPVILAPSEISVTVAEYRPIYVNGDVSKPGAQAYRPGLTVRQSIALAGGFDVLRFKMDNPFLQLADFRETYNQSWIAYAQEQQRLARIEAELKNRQQVDRNGLIDAPIAPSLKTDIANSENQILQSRLDEFAKQKTFLTDARNKEGERIKILSEQEKREKEGAQADSEEFKNLQELYGRGTVPLTRLNDTRRNLLLSSTRALQTTALLASVDREKGNLDRRLQQASDDRNLELLKLRQETILRLANIRSQLQAVSDKLRYAGMVKSQLSRGFDSDPAVSVFRQTPSGTRRISARTDTELMPGDVVEIALQLGENLDEAKPSDAAPSDTAPLQKNSRTER